MIKFLHDTHHLLSLRASERYTLHSSVEQKGFKTAIVCITDTVSQYDTCSEGNYSENEPGEPQDCHEYA